MTTWIGHLRIAETLLEKYPFDEEAFITGSIAPDSGIPQDEIGLSYDPPKHITHWLDEKKVPEPERFFETYLKSENILEPRRSFLIAYYLHLHADVQWLEQIVFPMRVLPEYEGWRKKDPKFVKAVKTDWYGQDFLYLSEHPNSIFYTHYQFLKSVPDYLDYFPPTAFTVQMQNIQKFYLQQDTSFLKDYIFRHLPEEKFNQYLERTVAVSEQLIKQHGW